MKGLLYYTLLILSLIVIFAPTAQSDEGRLRMCPPGGSSFTMAWSMACSMRRKRDTATIAETDQHHSYMKRALIAPSVRQLQTICCDVGCSVNNLLSYCGPLSAW